MGWGSTTGNGHDGWRGAWGEASSGPRDGIGEPQRGCVGWPAEREGIGVERCIMRTITSSSRACRREALAGLVGSLPSAHSPAVSVIAGFEVLPVRAGAGSRYGLRRRGPRLSAAAGAPCRLPAPAGECVRGLFVGRACGLARSSFRRCEVMLTGPIASHPQHDAVVACRVRRGCGCASAAPATFDLNLHRVQHLWQWADARGRTEALRIAASSCGHIGRRAGKIQVEQSQLLAQCQGRALIDAL